MPTIKDSLYFNFDGTSCKSFGLMNVNLDNGMFEESFGAEREIIETTVRGSDQPLLHDVEESPLQFTLTLAFEKGFTDEVIDKVILWLFKDRYRPLYFEDKPNKIYQCMPIGEASIAHNGLKQGYLVINMRCKSSKVESPTNVTPSHDFSVSGGGQISIRNTGHVEVYPEISIEKIGAGHVTITKNGKIFEIRDLTNAEKIYVNTQKEIIQTDIVGEYRFENVVGEYYNMALDTGLNTFTVNGNCKIAFRYVLKYRF